MIGVERGGIELDYCISCRGLWFDHGELDLLVELTGADLTRLDTVPSIAGAHRRRCPRCDARLEAETIAGIQMDRCPRGDGFWFDRGEVGRLVSQGLTQERSLAVLTSFLGEVFSQSST